MAMKKRVVISQSTVSAGQLEDFFRMIKDGTFGGEELAAFLENPKKFSKGLTIVRAISILGASKVITAEQASKAWEMEAPKSATIRYSEKVLRICAQENQDGEDWRLIYINGLSLREQIEKRGTDETKQPCFNNENWWLEKSEESWAKAKPQAGYYLINFKGKYAILNWNKQNAEIAKLGPDVERCHEAVFAEAILTICLVNGECIAESWYHWSNSASSDGDRVSVGHFDSDGLGVHSVWDGRSWDCLRVALVRKFN